jgi:iron complex outermembrane receptor protein
MSQLENEALDFGFNGQRQVRLKGTVSSRFGIDYFGRRQVEALETATDLESGGVSRQASLRDGREDEAGLYGALEWNWGSAVIVAGGRFAWQRQQNADQPSSDDTAASAFVGLVVPLGAGFELASNLGSGLRFPSLSERFFSGVTGRGEVIGNPRLDPERSVNLDLGLRWYGDRLFVSGYVFRNEIDDYIERVEVEPALLTFVNLTSGTIEGLELEGGYQIGPHWSVTFGGHLLQGRDDRDRPLADVPADRLFLGAAWRNARWQANARWEQRSEKTDTGSGEKPIPAASLLSAAVEYSFANGFALLLSGRNLLDEQYFNSADDKVPLAPGRSVGLALRWRAR